MSTEPKTNAVLVTGGAGYIGAHACKALANAGYEPVVFDNLSQGHVDAVRWGPLEQGDILNRERLDQVFKKHRPEAVMHFAASAYVFESIVEPAHYWRNNVTGTLTLLEVMQAKGVDKIVFSSSCAVFGNTFAQPASETTPMLPVSPYGRTKLVVEHALVDCYFAFALNSVSLRYFNAAGADASGEIGESHHPETHLIPRVLNSALDPYQPVTVYGTDYPTPDGTCIRDFIHVSDLADAHIRALEYLQENPGEHRFNLGNGNGFSVLQIIESVAAVTGRQPNVEFGPRRGGDPAALIADSSAARTFLSWTPCYPDILNMVDSAWKWRNRRGD
ncbi:MAG: UDP-glucose 4-epimerase GalE [bacterium]